MDSINKEIEGIKAMSAPGAGYGDPDAKEMDDRRLKILLHQDAMRWTRITSLFSLGISIVALAVSVIALFK